MTSETPWLTPEESCNRLKVSQKTYKLDERDNGIWYVVGTTPDGRRVHRSTRTRSRKTAAQRLALIVEQEEAGARATLSEVMNTPLEELLAAWLTSAATEVSSAQGDGSLFETYARHFLRFFQTSERICDEVAIEQYKEHRLGQVQATTVRGELSALRRLHRWMKKRKLLSALPEVPKVPKRATGTAHKLGKRKVIKLSPAEMDAIIARLPELTRKGYPVRDFVTFVRETSLRPSTVFGLRAPHDYEPGARLLRIRDENDKARFGRDVPIADRARKAIDSRFPCDGIIFPEFDCRDALRRAALAAGISAHRASRLSIYDFRHGRGTEWGTTGNLIGIAYLMGHKHVTTTKEYLHSNLEEAQSVSFRTSFFTSPAEAAPTTSELIAQAAEMIGCGREDSNLHECYLTRSLADTEPSQSLNLLEKGGSADVGKRLQTTLSGHGVPGEHSPVTGMGELRKAARAVVLQVADGPEVSIAALHDLATLTLRCELVDLAQRLLDAPPEFAVRRAMELAGLALTLGTKPRAAEGSPQANEAGDSAVPNRKLVEGKGSTS